MTKGWRKNRYSKKIPVITGIIFVAVLLLGFISERSSSGYSATVMVTEVSVAGGIFGAAIIWYMKKSQAENSFWLRMEEYAQISNIRAEYCRKMFEIKKEFSVTDNDIKQVDYESPMDEMEQSALGRVEQTVNGYDSDAHEEIRIQQY